MCHPAIQQEIMDSTRDNRPVEDYRPVAIVAYLPSCNLITTFRAGATSVMNSWPQFPSEYRWADDMDDLFGGPRPALVVLRNPKDRWRSVRKLVANRFSSRTWDQNKGLVVTHSMPWMHCLQGRAFYQLPFEDLDKWLPAKKTFQGVREDTLADLPTLFDYEEELATYHELRSNRPVWEAKL